ncbi:Oidioi.mRNA.OKI2018_I69.chr2.g8135.t1.cds [Oikopleura dioica]|uniref:Oidioi.mRNA.OKI2018_I69.chr2.g8135.t1.cds n=1 Tax=Oikopleura dioica TaxID=34765 RepID=A0ABN7T9B7_OIKDI|nr:Oidioi.mRNA.OKI2018_I69.chr2.g8135.t1.cds [Oikopleura dioica]
MSEIVRAAGLLIFRRAREIEFLLLKANYGKRHWSITKGHVGTIYEKEWTLRYDVKSHIDGIVRPKTVRIWLAEQISGAAVLSEEHSEMSWGNEEKSCHLLSDYQDMQELVHDAVHFIKMPAGRRKSLP